MIEKEGKNRKKNMYKYLFPSYFMYLVFLCITVFLIFNFKEGACPNFDNIPLTLLYHTKIDLESGRPKFLNLPFSIKYLLRIIFFLD